MFSKFKSSVIATSLVAASMFTSCSDLANPIVGSSDEISEEISLEKGDDRLRMGGWESFDDANLKNAAAIAANHYVYIVAEDGKTLYRCYSPEAATPIFSKVKTFTQFENDPVIKMVAGVERQLTPHSRHKGVYFLTGSKKIYAYKHSRGGPYLTELDYMAAINDGLPAGFPKIASPAIDIAFANKGKLSIVHGKSGGNSYQGCMSKFLNDQVKGYNSTGGAASLKGISGSSTLSHDYVKIASDGRIVYDDVIAVGAGYEKDANTDVTYTGSTPTQQIAATYCDTSLVSSNSGYAAYANSYAFFENYGYDSRLGFDKGNVKFFNGVKKEYENIGSCRMIAIGSNDYLWDAWGSKLYRMKLDTKPAN